MTIFTCYICNEDIHIALKESHHEIPKAYGGEHGEEKDLCNACHKILHTIANLIFYSKVDKVREILVTTYKLNKSMERLLGLAKIIVETRILKEEGKVSRDMEPILSFVSPEIKAALKLIAKDLKLDLKELTSRSLYEIVYRKYPKLRRS